jgi:hypothetical protein
MLRSEEFRVGALAAAADSPMTLVLPRTEYEHAAVFGDAFDQRYGIVLDGDLPFQAYPVKPDEPWTGILIPGVRIELNEKTAYNPTHLMEAGSVIREADRVNVAAVSGPHPHIGRPIMITLLNGLPECEPHERAGFREWRIVIGDRQDTRELLSVNAVKVAELRSATLQSRR